MQACSSPLQSFFCLYFSAAGLKNITARPGQNIILTCKTLQNDKTITLEWSRPDLGEEYVFLYRIYNAHQEDQHECFRNRVFLQDIQMTSGDLSVILKNVTLNDNGTYKCKIKQENDPPGELRLICVIHLLVSPAGEESVVFVWIRAEAASCCLMSV